MKWALGVLVAVTVGASCSGGDEASVERLQLGDVVVELRAGEDGRMQACVVSAQHVDLPDSPLCVGPHDGTRGPSHAWSAAARVGDDVLALVILGVGDVMADAWYVTAASARHPVTVAASLLRGYPGNVVCGTYVSGGVKFHFDTGVEVAGPGGGASTAVVPCSAQDGSVRLRPWLVESNVVTTDASAVRAAVEHVVSFFAEHGVAMELDPAERIVDPARAALLVDFTEATAPCATVRRALAVPSRLDTVDVVIGGHVSSTSPMRQLYGVSCEGRAETCSGGRGGMVLLDGSAAGEIDLGVVAAHEIGHVLGLRHPFEVDCAGSLAPDGAANLMALERDVSAKEYAAVDLAGLTLTDAQVRAAVQS